MRDARTKQYQRAASSGENGRTPRVLARHIVRFFVGMYGPEMGYCLDPCAGEFAFYRCLPDPKGWCEINMGRDFLEWQGHADWIITNPPWPAKRFAPIMQKALECADNIAFLLPVWAALGLRKRNKLACDAGFGRRTYVEIPQYINSTGLFSGSGLQLCVIHWQRGWRGPMSQYSNNQFCRPPRRDGTKT